MSTVPEWTKARRQHMVDTVPCRIHLISEDPDGLKGMDMVKVAKARKATFPILKPYADQLEGKQQWCIAAVPGTAWAKKVFPGERTSVAVEKLWEAILAARDELEYLAASTPLPVLDGVPLAEDFVWHE